MSQKAALKFSPVPRKVLEGRVASEPDQALVEKGRVLVRAIVQQLKQQKSAR